MNLLNKSFFTKDTIEVARNLLGCYLVRKTKQNGIIKGKIVETEAYLGVQDSCCHSYKGLYTDRTKTMYLEGGHAYIYFTYGMYHCFNVVTAQKNQPEAVLIRALEPIEGIQTMQIKRNKTELEQLTSGPGKLCQALSITRKLNGINLSTSHRLYIEKGNSLKTEPAVDARIGLPHHKEASYLPLRFFIKDNKYVSLKKALLK